jgi:phage recombination protein Bet
MSDLIEYTERHLRIIRASNPALESQEFDTLVEYSKRTGLDLFRRQLSAIVFGARAKDKSRRRVAFVIGIDGYRAMADRTGNYVPHEDPHLFETDLSLKSETNPAGLVSCTVKIKKDAHGSWHTYSATAHWDEFAPIEQAWGEDEAGRRKPTGKLKLGETWQKMPRVMLAKVAEAQALRRGWPDTLAGLYVAEELDRERTIDLTASETLEQADVTERLRKLGGVNAVTVVWETGSPLERIPDGAFVDRVLDWLRGDLTATEIRIFRDRNRAAFQEFWARHPGDALSLKQALEDREEELAAAVATAE